MDLLEASHIVVWTENAKLREQIVMLRIMSVYGTEEFDATYTDIAREIAMKRSVVIQAMKGLKELGWIESVWNYEKNGKNLPTVKNCKYTITIGKEPPVSD